jgi:ABC-type antimicrobial peptide transport system permease subunit
MHLLDAFLFGITSLDARAYGWAVATLAAAALLAAALPAYRAAAVDPSDAMRTDS